MKHLNQEVKSLSDIELLELSKHNEIASFPASFRRPTKNKKCEVRKSIIGGKGLFANFLLEKNELVLAADGEKFDKALIYSYQIDHDIHTLGLGALNHSCQPNCGIDCKNNIITLRKISEDEELNFNYLTTEYSMRNPFHCKCGSGNCYGFIQGFSYLNEQQKTQLMHTLPIAKYLLKNANCN